MEAQMPDTNDGNKGAAVADPAAASSAASSNKPDSAAAAASPADNGSGGVDDGHGNKVPDARFKEVIDEKNHYKSVYEETKARLETLEREAAERNKPPVTETKPDPFGDPEGFAREVARKETEPLKAELTSLVKERVENAIGEAYSKNRVMQKVFADKGKLFKAIAETAVKYGKKELTPQVIHAAYQQVIIDNQDTFNEVARNMGIEEEKAKARALDGSTVPMGQGSSTTATPGKPTSADRNVLKKAFGWDDDKINKKLANVKYDDKGNRKIERGGSNA